jgi:hypothetical protein
MPDSAVGLKAAGVNDDEFLLAQAGVAVVAVARQPGKVGHDGVARLGQPIEQGGLAHVGAAHQGDHGFHSNSLAPGRGGIRGAKSQTHRQRRSPPPRCCQPSAGWRPRPSRRWTGGPASCHPRWTRNAQNPGSRPPPTSGPPPKARSARENAAGRWTSRARHRCGARPARCCWTRCQRLGARRPPSPPNRQTGASKRCCPLRC